MTIPNLPLPLAEQGTANQNLHHAAQVTVNQLLHVAQVKVMRNLKPLPVVPHADQANNIKRKIH